MKGGRSKEREGGTETTGTFEAGGKRKERIGLLTPGKKQEDEEKGQTRNGGAEGRE